MAWTTSATPRGTFAERHELAAPRRRLRWPSDALSRMMWLTGLCQLALIGRSMVPIALANGPRPLAAQASLDPFTLAAAASGLLLGIAMVQRAGARSLHPDVKHERAFASLATSGHPANEAHERNTPVQTDRPNAATVVEHDALHTVATLSTIAALVVDAGPRHAQPPQHDLTSWAELSAQVSHEMRTPLNAVIGFTDVMHRELLGPVGHERYREYLGHIRTSSEALLKATEDTLTVTALLADPSQRERCAVTLWDLVIEARDRAVSSQRCPTVGIDWSIDVAPELSVEIEPRAFRQALLNLLTASVRHAGDAGCVRISASATHGAVLLKIAATSSEGKTSRTGQLGASLTASDERFPLCLARALLELQGTQLGEANYGATLELTASLDEAMQHDLVLFN